MGERIYSTRRRISIMPRLAAYHEEQEDEEDEEEAPEIDQELLKRLHKLHRAEHGGDDGADEEFEEEQRRGGVNFRKPPPSLSSSASGSTVTSLKVNSLQPGGLRLVVPPPPLCAAPQTTPSTTGPPHTPAQKGSQSTDLTRSQTFDDGEGEDVDEVFKRGVSAAPSDAPSTDRTPGSSPCVKQELGIVEIHAPMYPENEYAESNTPSAPSSKSNQKTIVSASIPHHPYTDTISLHSASISPSYDPSSNKPSPLTSPSPPRPPTIALLAPDPDPAHPTAPDSDELPANHPSSPFHSSPTNSPKAPPRRKYRSKSSCIGVPLQEKGNVEREQDDRRRNSHNKMDVNCQSSKTKNKPSHTVGRNSKSSTNKALAGPSLLTPTSPAPSANDPRSSPAHSASLVNKAPSPPNTSSPGVSPTRRAFVKGPAPQPPRPLNSPPSPPLPPASPRPEGKLAGPSIGANARAENTHSAFPRPGCGTNRPPRPRHLPTGVYHLRNHVAGSSSQTAQLPSPRTQSDRRESSSEGSASKQKEGTELSQIYGESPQGGSIDSPYTARECLQSQDIICLRRQNDMVARGPHRHLDTSIQEQKGTALPLEMSKPRHTGTITKTFVIYDDTQNFHGYRDAGTREVTPMRVSESPHSEIDRSNSRPDMRAEKHIIVKDVPGSEIQAGGNSGPDGGTAQPQNHYNQFNVCRKEDSVTFSNPIIDERGSPPPDGFLVRACLTDPEPIIKSGPAESSSESSSSVIEVQTHSKTDSAIEEITSEMPTPKDSPEIQSGKEGDIVEPSFDVSPHPKEENSGIASGVDHKSRSQKANEDPELVIAPEVNSKSNDPPSKTSHANGSFTLGAEDTAVNCGDSEAILEAAVTGQEVIKSRSNHPPTADSAPPPESSNSGAIGAESKNASKPENVGEEENLIKDTKIIEAESVKPDDKQTSIVVEKGNEEASPLKDTSESKNEGMLIQKKRLDENKDSSPCKDGTKSEGLISQNAVVKGSKTDEEKIPINDSKQVERKTIHETNTETDTQIDRVSINSEKGDSILAVSNNDIPANKEQQQQNNAHDEIQEEERGSQSVNQNRKEKSEERQLKQIKGDLNGENGAAIQLQVEQGSGENESQVGSKCKVKPATKDLPDPAGNETQSAGGPAEGGAGVKDVTSPKSANQRPSTLIPANNNEELGKPPLRSNVPLSKIREENLAKKRSLTKQSTMPELAETAESDSSIVTPSSSSMNHHQPHSSEAPLPPPPAPAAAAGGGGVCDGSSPMTAATAAANSAFPSLPDEALRQLGLFRQKGDALHMDDEEGSGDQFTDQEIEEKFASLALAFKTDKLTLEKRIDLHERARDIAEQNVNREIDGLKEAMKALSPFCTNAQSRDIYTKVQHHVEVLEQSTSRVSSRAEVHGAVQQELRMSKAIEVMVNHVENLKRIHDKEHQELEETKRILSENKVLGQNPDGDGLQKRSYSLAGGGGLKLGGRRRASVAAFPRKLSSIQGVVSSSGSPLPEHPMDPKTRFQTLVADTAMKTSVVEQLRRSVCEEHQPATRPNSLKNLKSSHSKTGENTHVASLIRDLAVNGEKTNLDSNSNINQEAVFQKGYEEGVRAKVGAELAGLRHQQRSFYDNLETLIDQNEISDEEEKSLGGSWVEVVWQLWPGWSASGRKLRLAVAGFIFMLAFLSLVMTLVPVGEASVRRRIPVTWASMHEFLTAYTQLNHYPGGPGVPSGPPT